MAKRNQDKRNKRKLERKLRKAKLRAQRYAESARRRAEKGSKHKAVKRTPKVNGYSHVIADARMAQRRADANARQAEYNALSVEDRITLARSRRGESKREISRLEANT